MRFIRRESATDIRAELAEVGLSEQSGWWAGIALYLVGGLTVITARAGGAEVSDGLFTMALIAIALSVFYVYGAFKIKTVAWVAHVRLSVAVVIFSLGAAFSGELGEALVLLPTIMLVTPCYMYGTRFAVRYSVPIIGVTIFILATIDAPNKPAHVAISMAVVVLFIASMMASEQRTRALARLNRKLAYTDPLTGLANTRKLRESLAEQIATGSREFALFAIDLDNFKRVNDEFDHTTGDDVLKAVAAALAAQMEPNELVARRGGDEFSILVPDADKRNLEELTHRLRAAIIAAREAVCPAITPSGSVAWVRGAGDADVAELLQRADDELHRAKLEFHASSVADDGTWRDANAISLTPAPPPEVDRLHSKGGRDRHTWNSAGALFLGIGLIDMALCVAGLMRPLEPVAGAGFASAVLAVAGFCALAARTGLPLRWLQYAFTAALAIQVGQSIAAGPAGAAQFEVFPLLMLYSFYFFRPRQAAANFVVIAASTVIVGVTQGYDHGGVRALVDVASMGIAGAITMRVRGISTRFVRLNRELAEIDALTGVANMRALAARAADRIGANECPALISIDLIDFKSVNDKYNHTVGDNVLVAVARAVTESLRAGDLVARRGGDEFLVLCEDTQADSLDELCDRLRKAIAHARRRICPDLADGASVASCVRERDEAFQDLLVRTDRALHDQRDRDHGRTPKGGLVGPSSVYAD